MPHLLADVDSFIAIVFMVVAFFSWVINTINQAKSGPPQRPGQKGKPPQKAPRDHQSEIERFLNESRKQEEVLSRRDPFQPGESVEQLERPQKNSPKRRPPPAAQRRRSRQEVWEEQTKGREQGQRPAVAPTPQRPAPLSARPSLELPSQSGRNQPGKAPPRNAGTLQKNIPTAAPKQSTPGQHSSIASVKPSISQSTIQTHLQEHLGKFSAISPDSIGEQGISSTIKSAPSPARRIAQLMRNPRHVRDVIILGEVLSRPRVLNRNDR